MILTNSLNQFTLQTSITVILDGVGLNDVQNHLSSYLVIVGLCPHGTLTKSEIRLKSVQT